MKLHSYLFERNKWNKFRKDAVVRSRSEISKQIDKNNGGNLPPSFIALSIKLKVEKLNAEDKIDNNPTVQRRKQSGNIDFKNKYELDNKIGFFQKHESYYAPTAARWLNEFRNYELQSRRQFLLEELYIRR